MFNHAILEALLQYTTTTTLSAFDGTVRKRRISQDTLSYVFKLETQCKILKTLAFQHFPVVAAGYPISKTQLRSTSGKQLLFYSRQLLENLVDVVEAPVECTEAQYCPCCNWKSTKNFKLHPKELHFLKQLRIELLKLKKVVETVATKNFIININTIADYLEYLKQINPRFLIDSTRRIVIAVPKIKSSISFLHILVSSLNSINVPIIALTEAFKSLCSQMHRYSSALDERTVEIYVTKAETVMTAVITSRFSQISETIRIQFCIYSTIILTALVATLAFIEECLKNKQVVNFSEDLQQEIKYSLYYHDDDNEIVSYISLLERLGELFRQSADKISSTNNSKCSINPLTFAEIVEQSIGEMFQSFESNNNHFHVVNPNISLPVISLN